jgi:hypothetical protein
MSRLKYWLTSCVLALTVSFGLGVALPSYSSADTVYTFTFFENLSFTENSIVTGSFSIPVADFSTAVSNNVFSLLTDNISAVSLIQDSHPFGLSNVLDGYNLFFNMDGANVPQVWFESAGWLVTLPTGCNPSSTTCTWGIQPGNIGLVDVIIPAGETQIFGDWVTTTESTATPLPAALPLFATGLGALGLLGWRRKRKAAAVAA